MGLLRGLLIRPLIAADRLPRVLGGLKMDRLDEIREGLAELDVDFIESAEGNIRWLIAEVERMSENMGSLFERLTEEKRWNIQHTKKIVTLQDRILALEG